MLVKVERGSPFNLQTIAPRTPDEARQSVDVFHGTRFPKGHPLNLDQFDIPYGIVVLTQDNRKVLPDIDRLWQFMERIKVPTVPLVPGGVKLSDPAERWRLRSVTDKLLGIYIKAAELDAPGVPDFKANPALVMFLDPLGNWQVDAIMISDCLKETSALADEIQSLKKKHPSPAETFRRYMKELVYYLLQGEVYA